MSNNLSVSDITPLGERPADVWRGRTGTLGAGVFTIAGSALAGSPTTSGDLFVYDSSTDTWVIVNDSTFGVPLTVEDEGVPLATSASVLNFVGTGVTATGSGGTKTITIPGVAAGTYELANEGGQDLLNALGSVSGAVSVDPTLGNVASLTLTGTTTTTIAAPVGSGGSTLEWWVTQDGTGGRALTIAATGGSVTNSTTPDTTAGVTVRYVLDRLPGTSNDWIVNIVGGSTATFATPSGGYGTAAAGTGTNSMRATAVLPKPTAADVDFSANVTTNNVSITAHGLAPILPNDATKYLDGTGAYTVPAGSGSGGGADPLPIMNVTYSGDASRTAFELPAAPFDAYSVAAYVAGTRTDVTLSGGLLTTMTFGSAPASGTNNVVVDILAAAT